MLFYVLFILYNTLISLYYLLYYCTLLLMHIKHSQHETEYMQSRIVKNKINLLLVTANNTY